MDITVKIVIRNKSGYYSYMWEVDTHWAIRVASDSKELKVLSEELSLGCYYPYEVKQKLRSMGIIWFVWFFVILG